MRPGGLSEEQQLTVVLQVEDRTHHCMCSWLFGRLEPDNKALKADALEVSLALHPSSSVDPAAIKELATARFKAGELEAAAEAYTALIQLLHGTQHTRDDAEAGDDGQQSQQPQQTQLAGALSNRAACWLALNKYAECVQDCWAAYDALLPAVCERRDAAVRQLQEQSPEQLQQMLLLRRRQRNNKEEAADDVLPLLRSAALIVGRMAAAYSCLKTVPAADAAYVWAAACWQLLGEHGRVASTKADHERWLLGGACKACDGC